MEDYVLGYEEAVAAVGGGAALGVFARSLLQKYAQTGDESALAQTTFRHIAAYLRGQPADPLRLRVAGADLRLSPHDLELFKGKGLDPKVLAAAAVASSDRETRRMLRKFVESQDPSEYGEGAFARLVLGLEEQNPAAVPASYLHALSLTPEQYEKFVAGHGPGDAIQLAEFVLQRMEDPASTGGAEAP